MINDVAMAFLVISFVLSFFPETPMPGVQGMNWAVVMFVAVLALAIAFYYVSAHKTYKSPVLLVKND